MNIKQFIFLLVSLVSSSAVAGVEPDFPFNGSLADLKEEIRWVNPQAMRLYLNDIAPLQKEKIKTLEAKLVHIETLLPEVRQILNRESLSDKEREKAFKVLTLKREIMLANPLLDNARIVVARYGLGEKARKAMGPSLGTPPANYSSLLSCVRKGFDAEICELSGLRKTIARRTIYKPTTDVPLSELQLHWDGNRILFSSLDANRKWQVFEVHADGRQMHQKIVSEEPDLEFCDANYLPDGRVVATANIGYNGVPCVHGQDVVANLISFDPQNGALSRLTFDQDGNWSPVVMSNGRIMYTRWEYTDLTHYFSRIVMHMNPDGTENKALYGSGSYFPNSTFDMKPIPGSGSRFIGIISGHHGIARSGRLILFDPAKGRKEEKGMIQEIPFRNRPIEPIIKDYLVDGVWPQFMKPYPLNDTYFLVAAKLHPDALWGIYLVDVFDNMTLVAADEGAGLTSPLLLKETKTPPIIPSKEKKGDSESTVFIQDLYEGEGLKGVPRGTVKALRIFAYEYAYINSPSDHDAQGIQSGWDIKRILGTVPVEKDGSALFRIPANTPVSIQPLDEKGAAIQWMRSWLVGKPGEVVSCVGCHEDQNTVPIPKKTIASTIRPHKLLKPEGGIRPFTFRLEVQPVLDRNCVRCHNGSVAKPDFRKGQPVVYKRGVVTKLERYYDPSYLNLHPYVYRQGPEADIHVLPPYEYYVNNSELIRILQAGHHGVRIHENDWKTLYAWIDLNAPFFGVFMDIKNLNGIDQVKRRQELAEKYSGVKVDWQKEIEDYALWLKQNKGPESALDERKTDLRNKQITTKGFPFNASQAKQKQNTEGSMTRKLKIAPNQFIEMVWIPKGSFVMGENQIPLASPAFRAKVQKGFWMSTTEITNEQFRTLFPEHDSRYIGQTWKDHTTPGYAANRPKQPVVRVSWDHAVAFCKKVGEINNCNVSLPSETQWEWAARAGSSTAFWFGSQSSDFGQYENLADSTLVDWAVIGVNPRPMSPQEPIRKFWDYLPKMVQVKDGKLISSEVAGYLPNPWGLYDMNGNVAEWTISNFQPYPLKEKDLGKESTQKVVRGGSWIDRPEYSQSAVRKTYYPWQRPFNVGFRVIVEGE